MEKKKILCLLGVVYVFLICPVAYREKGKEKKQTIQSSEECKLSAMLWNNLEVKCEFLQYIF